MGHILKCKVSYGGRGSELLVIRGDARPMEQQNLFTLINAIEKAAEGLRSTAVDLEKAAKQMGEMQNAVSPNAVKQLDRIEELLNRIPADLPEKLEMIDKFIKLILLTWTNNWSDSKLVLTG